MKHYLCFLMGCMSILSVGLTASQTDVQSYKTQIIMETSKALSQEAKISPKATPSSSSEKKMTTCCGEVTVIRPKDINPNGYSINKPGIYHVDQNAAFNPSGPGLAAITINSDGVVLDLCKRTLSGGNAASKTVGILVNAKNNVLIKNGTVSGFSLFGVRILPGSSFVTVKNFNAFNNGVNDPVNLTVSGGIVAAGDGSHFTHDIVLNNVDASGNFLAGFIVSGVVNTDVSNSKFNNNKTATTLFGINTWGVLATAFGIDSVFPCENLNVTNCEMNNNTSAGGTVGLEVLSVPAFGLPFNNNVNIINCVANSNTGGGTAGVVNEGEGIVLAGTQNFTVQNCVAQGNRTLATAPSGKPGFFASTGFGVPFFGVNGTFENCVAQGNSGAGDSSQGFRILRSNNITVSNCVAIGNNNTATSGGEAWGFTTDPLVGNTAGAFGPPVNNNFLFIDCVAETNVSSGGLSGGFKFVSQVDSSLTQCKAISNGYGILVADPACCATNTCCTVDPVVCKSGTNCLPFAACCPTSKNVISYNEVIGNTSFGIVDESNSNAHNAYFANIARGNGHNFTLPAGTPIRHWKLPAFPHTTDNNGILDTQLDNISISH